MMVLQEYLSEKIPALACDIVKCQIRDFPTELCCNIIIRYFLSSPTLFLKFSYSISVALQ